MALEKPKRSFTKKVALVNLILAWLVIFASIYFQLPSVANMALGLVITLFGLYAGVGHLDYREVLKTYRETNKQGYGGYTYDYNTNYNEDVGPF